MAKSTIQTQQEFLFDDSVEQTLPAKDSNWVHETIGSDSARETLHQGRHDPESSSAVEAVETVQFDMSNKDEVLECVDQALEDLERSLAKGQSEGLKSYLKFLAGFHSYSFRNMMLILMQNPEATMVAGYKAWQKMGRQVSKGQKGLKILAPIVRKRKTDESDSAETKPETQTDDQPKKVVTGFRLASVFDVTQTEGDALPEFGGYSGDPAENLERLKSFIASKNIELLIENPGGGALGISENGLIKVHPDLGPADTFAVMVHEVAHELLHKGQRRKETTASIRETEAEAVAYAVCSAVGLEDHSKASDYIQLHQGDTEKFRQSLEIIRKTASEILTELKQHEKK